MKYLISIKFAGILALFFVFFLKSNLVFAFDDDIKIASEEKPMLTQASKVFSESIDTYGYASCTNAYLHAKSTWAQSSNLDRTFQLTWQLIGNGLNMYRQDFIQKTGTDQPLDEALERIDMAYYQANMESILKSCSNAISQAFDKVQ